MNPRPQRWTMARGITSTTTGIASLDRVVRELSKLPGIGPRMALRLAYNMLKRDRGEVRDLADSLERLSYDVGRCSVCGNYTESDPCRICSDSDRDQALLCVVEQPQDLLALEHTGSFDGLYHVLGGALSPIDGIGPEELGISRLLERLKGPVDEVVLATNPNMEGNATAVYLAGLIKPLGIRVTRLAQGLPSGTEVEFADEVTLSSAFSARREA